MILHTECNTCNLCVLQLLSYYVTVLVTGVAVFPFGMFLPPTLERAPVHQGQPAAENAEDKEDKNKEDEDEEYEDKEAWRRQY